MSACRGSRPTVWDAAASSYDEARIHDPVYESCLRQVGNTVREADCCLDAGCGTGLSTTLVAPRCKAVVAVDYSIESLRALLQKAVSNIFPVQADLTALPFADETFDACTCTNALQHLAAAAQRAAAREMHRVCRNGATIAVSVHFYSRHKARAGWIKEGKPGQRGIDYIFRFTRRELVALFPSAGVKAAGFYALARLRDASRRRFGTPARASIGARDARPALQDICARLLGSIAARIGWGHMLVATETRRDRNETCQPSSATADGRTTA